MAKALVPSPKPLLSLPTLPLFPSSKPLYHHHHHHHRHNHHHRHHKRFNSQLTPLSNLFRNGSTPPGTGFCPVPVDQQPINEYQNLSNCFPFSWASSGDGVEYSSRLFATGLGFALLVGLPVSWFGSVGPEPDPVKLVLSSVSTGLFAVTLAVVRMYLGWAYVGNRLLSATVEYEETGWYDGQIWVKTAEVLARDRLLGSFQVKPVLNRLKNSLVALAISLCLCVSVLVNYEGSQKKPFHETGDRVVPGVYNDNSARSFEPDAFCGEPGLVPE